MVAFLSLLSSIYSQLPFGWLACIRPHPFPAPHPPCSHGAHRVNRQLAGPGLRASRERAWPPGDKEQPEAAKAGLIPGLICSLGLSPLPSGHPASAKALAPPPHFSMATSSPQIPSALPCCGPAPCLSLRSLGSIPPNPAVLCSPEWVSGRRYIFIYPGLGLAQGSHSSRPSLTQGWVKCLNSKPLPFVSLPGAEEGRWHQPTKPGVSVL